MSVRQAVQSGGPARFTKVDGDPSDYGYEALFYRLRLGLPFKDCLAKAGIKAPWIFDNCGGQKRVWTDEEINRLKHMFVDQKMKPPEMALEIGCGLAQMYNILHDTGVMPRREKKW